MNYFLELYKNHLLVSVFIIIFWLFLKFFFQKLILAFGKKSTFDDNRIKLTIKYSNLIMNALLIIILFLFWGVSRENVFFTVSSVFAVIGVAFFAQWSILSNVTAGFILFFNAPFKIGKKIRIHDNDLPEKAEIIDIKGFYTFLKTDENDVIIIPNNLLMQKAITLITDDE